jgi:hypothetical protein
MADQIITNEVPSTNTQWFQAFRLVEQLILAGWTVIESSKGTADTPAASDRWSGDFGNLVADAWIILESTVAGHILFRRGTSSSNGDGWIIWSKGKGFTTGGTATAPANIPADAAEVRGTFVTGTPGSFTTDGSWFGSTTANTYNRLNIGCRDAATDGSFWVVAKQTVTSYSAGSAATHARLAFEELAHPAGLGIVDATPYAWWCPESATGNWGYNFFDLRQLLEEDNAGGTSGFWRRWWNAGQGSESWEQYGSSGSWFMGYASDAEQWGRYPSWYNALDQVLYQATPQQVIHRVHLVATLTTGKKDPEGGYTQNIFFTEPTDVPNLSTLITGDYAKFGDWLTVWWDGNAGNPPTE